MLKKLLILLSITTITACGGGGGGKALADKIPAEETPAETTAQIEKRLNLPPAPDLAEDEKTVLGIDSDEKGIKGVNDKLERIIGFAFPNDPYARKVYNRQAELWALMVKEKNAIDNGEGSKEGLYNLYDEYWVILGCDSKGLVASHKDVENLELDYLNTPKRDAKMKEIMFLMLDYDYSSSNDSKEKTKKYCERLK